MKKIATLIAFFSVCFCSAYAQTTIYLQTFNTGSASDWTLNTTDHGCIGVSSSDNQWIINNVYTGGGVLITVPTIDAEPSGITGYPASDYLHIYNPEDVIYGVPNNCNFLAAGTNSYFAAMTTPTSTAGYTGVSFSFWWLCQGDAGAYGTVYYRTSSTGTWTAIPGGPATYYGSSTWAQQIVTSTLLDDQPFLEFGVEFTEDATGDDPAFAVDDVKLVGTLTTSTTPTPSFTENHTTVCQDSCIVFTNTSTGTIDSFTWSMPGATITQPHGATDTVCFSAAGTYTMTLTVYHAGTPYITTTAVTVNPTPHPTITFVGLTLSTGSLYTSYQWYSGTSPILGATTNSVVITATGTYEVVVDSGGCYGYATFDVLSLSIPSVNGAEVIFSDSKAGNGDLALHASLPLGNAIAVNIYDATGRLALHDTWQAGGDTKQVSAAFLPPGLYIIKLTGEGTSTALKWVK